MHNNFPNGKGKEYCANTRLKYDGDFIDGLRDGKGKFFMKMVIIILVNFQKVLNMVKEVLIEIMEKNCMKEIISMM